MSLRILHLSDLHFGAVDPGPAEALTPLARDLACDLTVISGDLTQRARPRQFADLRDLLARLPGRKLLVPGNHDIPMYSVWERFTRPLRRYRRHLHPATEARILLGDVEILGLDSVRTLVPIHDGFWKDGALSDRQLRSIGPGDGRRLRIVVLHHPLIPPPGLDRGGTLFRAPDIAAALADTGVAVALAGHLHQPYTGVLASPHGRHILCIQAGTASSTRRRPDSTGTPLPNSLNLLTLDGPSLQVETLQWSGTNWQVASRERWLRDSDHWRGPDTA